MYQFLSYLYRCDDISLMKKSAEQLLLRQHVGDDGFNDQGYHIKAEPHPYQVVILLFDMTTMIYKHVPEGTPSLKWNEGHIRHLLT